MGKQATQRKEWWVLRTGTKWQAGAKKEIGPLTHRDARATAYQWYVDGWAVVLHRRNAAGTKIKEIDPNFPGVPRNVGPRALRMGTRG